MVSTNEYTIDDLENFEFSIISNGFNEMQKIITESTNESDPLILPPVFYSPYGFGNFYITLSYLRREVVDSMLLTLLNAFFERPLTNIGAIFPYSYSAKGTLLYTQFIDDEPEDGISVSKSFVVTNQAGSTEIVNGVQHIEIDLVNTIYLNVIKENIFNSDYLDSDLQSFIDLGEFEYKVVNVDGFSGQTQWDSGWIVGEPAIFNSQDILVYNEDSYTSMNIFIRFHRDLTTDEDGLFAKMINLSFLNLSVNRFEPTTGIWNGDQVQEPDFNMAPIP